MTTASVGRSLPACRRRRAFSTTVMLDAGHRGGRPDGFEHAHDRERDHHDVVGERPEQVLADHAGTSAERASTASATAGERPPRSVHVGGGERDVGAAADRDADVGRGERRRVVQPVADERDARPVVPATLHLLDLALGEHLGDHVVDPGLRGDRPGGRPAVTRDQGGPDAHRRRRAATRRGPPASRCRPPPSARRGPRRARRRTASAPARPTPPRRRRAERRARRGVRTPITAPVHRRDGARARGTAVPPPP